MNHNQVVERRRNGHTGQTPMDTLKQLPALVVLERIPVPVLAIAQDGAVVFANSAFSEMVGRAPVEVLSLKFDEIFHLPPTRESAVSVVKVAGELHKQVGVGARDRLVVLDAQKKFAAGTSARNFLEPADAVDRVTGGQRA
jgi:PAS domain-containing protein